MLKTAICDDNEVVCFEIETHILDYAKRNALDISVEFYFSGERLIRDLNDSVYYDLIFLDIQLNQAGLDGIETGSEIRNKLHLYSLEIVYISSFSQYAMELFKIQPMDFLLKPIEAAKMNKILDQFIKQEHISSKKFKYKIGREEYKIPLKEIVFFKSDRREMELYTANGDIRKFYSSMAEVMEKSEFLNGSFFSPHKSYIVNYFHVMEFHHEYLSVTNNHKIPISQNKRKFLYTMQKEIENGR